MAIRTPSVLAAFAVTTTLAATRTAAAQIAEIVPADAIKGADKTDVQGWAPFLTLTGTMALADSQNVVGQVNGASELFGLGLTGGTDYITGPHLFRSTLTVNEGFAKTPVVDDYVKTTDIAKFESLYNYFITPNFGLFGRLGLQTALFDTEDVRGTPTSWVLLNSNGSETPLTTNGLRQQLADAWQPFSIGESAGVFVEPLRRDELALSLRFGVGGRSEFAAGVLSNAGVAPTLANPQVDLVELQSVEQLGLEGFVGAVGKLSRGKAHYKAGLSVLYPFVNDDMYDRSAATLTRVAFDANLTFNVYSWMGLVYNVAIIRDPELFPLGEDRVSMQNTLLLTFQLSVVKKPTKPKEPTKEQLALAAALDAAWLANIREKQAELRARDWQQQLRELQLQLAPPPVAPPPAAVDPFNPPLPPTPPAPPLSPTPTGPTGPTPPTATTTPPPRAP